MLDRGFKITRILNNNVVMILDDGGHEIIAFGKGIGFRNHVGVRLPRKDVLKTFVNLDSSSRRKLLTLLEEIPFECIEATEDIIEYAEDALKTKLNPGVLINLADHISFTLSRYREGIAIPVMISEEIKQFYPDEYRVGLHAVQMLNGFFGVNLENEEASAIAFHLINAMYANDGSKTRRIIQSIDDLSVLICNELGIERDEDSLVHSRLVIHLKFFLRELTGSEPKSSTLSPEEASEMLKTLLAKHSGIESCLDQVARYIRDRYAYDMSGEDLLYLGLHLARLLESG